MEVYTQEIIIGLGVITFALVILVIRLEIRLHKVLRGGKAPTLEDSITLIEHDIKGLKHFTSELLQTLDVVLNEGNAVFECGSLP
ncbi:MAG: hypothetical protein NUV54_02205, partial [Candidatus Taylorbacteria bacterium]|nr:hypothetical protein [Candidatus Taylorbacteria bacterium]